MNPIGIMQGRLSPPVGGRIQSFPVDTWRDEFFLAREAGLDRIEWIYEAGTDADNPLGTDDGLEEIRQLVEDSGVAVRSVCADYYMAERLVTQDGVPKETAVRHLVWLVERAAALGAQHIVLPFVDASSLQSSQELEGLLMVLKSVVPAAERGGVELHLETDLQAPVLEQLLRDGVESPAVRVNYDIGNEAWAGHDPKEDLPRLGPSLGSVHVKDRLLGGGTVPLGTGSAHFDACFRMFAAVEYTGSFVLQAARGDDGDEVQWAKRNRRFVKRQLDAAAHGS